MGGLGLVALIVIFLFDLPFPSTSVTSSTGKQHYVRPVRSASVRWVARASGVITREDDVWQEVYWWFWSGLAFIWSVSYIWVAANTCQTLYGNLVCP